jgi:hypothetical protein
MQRAAALDGAAAQVEARAYHAAPVPEPPPALWHNRIKESVGRALGQKQPFEELVFRLAPRGVWLHKANPVRWACIRAHLWRPLDGLLLAAIIANAITLALDSNAPGFKDTQLAQSLQTANYVFIVLFAMEAAIRIIAMGFIIPPASYLRDGA